MTEDFYDLLDVSPDATQPEIKEAYREMVRHYHPDVNDDDRARAQFTALTKANEILTDPVERRAYDRLGHETYVAKRTSGIPSPEVWVTNDSDRSKKDHTSSANRSGSHSSSATADSQASSGRTGSTTSSQTGRSTSGRRSRSNTHSRTRPGDQQSTDATGNDEATSSTTGSTSSEATATGSNSGTTAGTTRQGHVGSSSRSRSEGGLIRWWRRRNFAMALLWSALLVYCVGVGHYVLENWESVRSLQAELVTVGLSPAALADTLSSSRYGLESGLEFVLGFGPLAPSLSPQAWYGLLGGIIATSLLAVSLARFRWRDEPTGPITIDETIVFALGLGLAAVLFGGPLLAGAILMPFLFGVIVHHTRRRPGWHPSYLYVLPVFGPAGGLGANAAGYATLPVDLLAFVVFPIVGGLCLPIRAAIRKYLGR